LLTNKIKKYTGHKNIKLRRNIENLTVEVENKHQIKIMKKTFKIDIYRLCQS